MRGHSAGRLDVVQDDGEVDTPLANARDMCQFARRDADRVENVGKSVAGEILRLLEGRHRDGARAAIEHAARHIDRLAGLDVRAESDAQRSHARAHARYVGVQLLFVENERGGFKCVQLHASMTRVVEEAAKDTQVPGGRAARRSIIRAIEPRGSSR